MSWLPKSRKARRRLMVAAAVAPVLALSAGLSLYAMSDGIEFFYSPAQLEAAKPPAGRLIRIGGLVEAGSVRKGVDGTVSFTVTDGQAALPVSYRGDLPDLFREGQGVVARGTLQAHGGFAAREVLAKHDERYMPKEVTDALKASGEWRPDSAAPARMRP